MTKEKKAKSGFLVQGSILAIAGIFVRLIGLVYRIPMTNILGDEGIGVYSAAFQIYNVILILSSYSMPLAVSKLVSSKVALKEYRNSYRIFLGALGFGLVIGTLAGAITYFGADFFAENILNMKEAAYAIRVLAPAIFVMAILGVLRGFFQGQGTMIPTALSQIFEQIVNALVSVTAAYYLFRYGLRSDLVHSTDFYANAYGAAGGTLGTLSGAVTALLFFVFLFLLYQRVLQKQLRKDVTSRVYPYSEIVKSLVLTIVPVVISSTVYNISALIDNSMFGYYMETTEQLESYKSIWGTYSGKYHLMANVPVAIATSLASSAIPALSKAIARKQKAQVIESIGLTVHFTMLIAIPSAVGLAVLASPIMNLLFRGNTDLAARMMIYGSGAVVFFSLSTVTNGVLQGINHLREPIKNAAISLILHVIVLGALLWGTKESETELGIYAVVIANMLFGLSMCLLNQFSIARLTLYRQEIKKTFILPLLCAGVMGAVVYGVYTGITAFIPVNLIGILVSIGLGVPLYFVLLLATKSVDEVELLSMPFGRKLIAVGKKLHML